MVNHRELVSKHEWLQLMLLILVRFFFYLNIFPTSKIILDLIFLPPGNNPYFIGAISSEELNFDK